MNDAFNEDNGALVGTLYNKGAFKRHEVELKEGAHLSDWKRFLYKNGYVEFWEMGHPEELAINCYFHMGYRNEGEPLYILEINDIQGTHEFYFLENFLALNDLLKIFNPVLEIAIHLEKRSQQNEENRSRF